MSVLIYGASDDLIEVEGDFYDEFNWIAESGEAAYIACSDGTLLRVSYDGIWHFDLLETGSAEATFELASAEDGNREDGKPAYSDIVRITGDVKWVVFGTHKAEPKA